MSILRETDQSVASAVVTADDIIDLIISGTPLLIRDDDREDTDDPALFKAIYCLHLCVHNYTMRTCVMFVAECMKKHVP